MEDLIFNSWSSLARIVFISVFAYTGLILMLRVSGNRTLSQLNAFDFVVTVALGSILATVILNEKISLVDGLVALSLLVLLQMAVSSLSVRFSAIRRIIKSDPVLIFYNGQFLKAVLRKKRITEDEVLQILRSNGIGTLVDGDAIVLETNGKFSVIKHATKSKSSALNNVTGIR